MARMLPPEPGVQTSSNAERRLFGTFRAQLDERWTVLHSVGIAKHQSKRWAEADFLLVGPVGVFVLEVKGGRIRRDGDGRWTFIDGSGHESHKHEGPFDQAGGCAGALQAYLTGERRSGRLEVRQPFEVGWGVMMPDIEFNIRGPDVELELLYDQRDVGRPVEAFLARVADYWKTRWSVRSGSSPSGLSPVECSAVVRALRPAFDIRPSLRQRVGQVVDELVRCTEDQFQVLDALDENERVVVRGGAGTGKTLLAVEEARRQAREGKSVLLTCMTKALGVWLTRTCADEPLITVRHFHAFLAELVHGQGLAGKLPSGVSDDDLHAVFYPELALEAVLESDRTGAFDVLILDEAQDLLLDSYLDVFDALLGGGLQGGTWRVFLDPNQNLFAGLNTDVAARLETGGFTSFRLGENCRNTTEIATLAALLSRVRLDRTETAGPAVEVSFCRDPAEMRRKASRHVSRLLSDAIKPEEIVVLSPMTHDRSCLAEGFENVSAPLVDYVPDADRKGKIAYATVGSFKGLESDAVVLVDVDGLGTDWQKSTLYVGTTRARALLAVFLDSGLKDDYHEAARDFGELIPGGDQAD